MVCAIHGDYTQCMKALWSRNLDSDCKICNCMIHTINIRRSERKKKLIQSKSKYAHYEKFMDALNDAWSEEFPSDCRHLASFCSNVYHCSNDSEERAWAQTLAVWLVYEKFFISYQHTKDAKPISRDCFKKDLFIFEPVLESDDAFRNVMIKDMEGIVKFPLLYKFYLRAMRILLTEKRSYTKKIFDSDKNTRFMVKDMLKLWKKKLKK